MKDIYENIKEAIVDSIASRTQKALSYVAERGEEAMANLELKASVLRELSKSTLGDLSNKSSLFVVDEADIEEFRDADYVQVAIGNERLTIPAFGNSLENGRYRILVAAWPVDKDEDSAMTDKATMLRQLAAEKIAAGELEEGFELRAQAEIEERKPRPKKDRGHQSILLRNLWSKQIDDTGTYFNKEVGDHLMTIRRHTPGYIWEVRRAGYFCDQSAPLYRYTKGQRVFESLVATGSVKSSLLEAAAAAEQAMERDVPEAPEAPEAPVAPVAPVGDDVE